MPGPHPRGQKLLRYCTHILQVPTAHRKEPCTSLTSGEGVPEETLGPPSYQGLELKTGRGLPDTMLSAYTCGYYTDFFKGEAKRCPCC